MNNLTVEISRDTPVHEQAVEIVERKGVGHPDSICDAVMDRISVELSREYIKKTGRVLHHNIDKGLLVAGQVSRRFGGGRVVAPMEFIIGDRAANRAGNIKIPVEKIARDTVRAWLGENMRHLDPYKDVKIRVVLQPGSVELSGIFDKKGVLGANDTSAAVGYAPLTPTEKAVYEVERFMNSAAFKLRFPQSCEDVKVMGVRRGRNLDITVACPLASRLVKSERAYFERKKAISASLKRFLENFPFDGITVNYNTLDRTGRGLDGVYLALLGTSAEDGDSGEVGRGNRVNGVISLNRPMGTEAAAGKNPVSHTGKIYNVLAHLMANELYKRIGGIKEVYVWMLSQIGSPINRPKQVYIRIIPGKDFKKRALGAAVPAILDEFLCGIGSFTAELSRGEHPVC